MSRCETGCKFNICSGYGGSLLLRRCEQCGGIEIDIREEPLGVSALLGTTYEPFEVDFVAAQARLGAGN